MQPTYMPWMGYFSMIDEVDKFVFLDHVQLVMRSWQVRNKIKINDQEKVLTIPIEHAQVREQRTICNTRFADNKWKKSHLEIIKQAYRRAEYFEEVYSFLEESYKKEYTSIGEFNIYMISTIAQKLGIETQFYRSSEMNISGNKDKLLVDICKKLKANYYLSAQGSSVYIEHDKPGGEFAAQGIHLYYQNYSHPQYKQLGEKFISHIGIYDLLFQVGFSKALKTIRLGQEKAYSFLEYRRNVLGITEDKSEECL